MTAACSAALRRFVARKPFTATMEGTSLEPEQRSQLQKTGRTRFPANRCNRPLNQLGLHASKSSAFRRSVGVSNQASEATSTKVDAPQDTFV